jgi:hypothetical protein
MRKISKFCKIYCHQNHKKWAELVPYIENWLNTTISGSTGYRPVPLIFDEDKPDLFERLIKKSPEQLPATETLQDISLRSHAMMKKRADDRKRRRKKGTKLETTTDRQDASQMSTNIRRPTGNNC